MRVLFITLTNIGDVVLSTALLSRVLKDHPNAVVDVVCGPSAAPLLEGMPNLGRLMPLVKRKHHLHYWDLYKKLRGENYDVVIDLRTPLLNKLISAPKKIVYKAHGNTHKALQYASLWPGDGVETKVWVSPDVARRVADKLPKNRPLIAIAPTANWLGKQWPQKSFAQLVAQLLKKPEYAKAQFAIFGAAHERENVADFIASIPQENRVDLVGQTTLPEACAWLSHADVFIGNDSGLGHMAAAAGVACISLFGPTDEKLYAPRGPKSVTICAPERAGVNLESEAKKRVMGDITVADVLDKALPMLQTNVTKAS